MYQYTNPECAWDEGWADFFAVSANEGACFDFVPGDCQGNNVQSIRLEQQSFGDYWDQPGYSWVGDQVEGRIAGVLWDILDRNQEGLDSVQVSFAEIEKHFYENAYQERNLNEFYLQWRTHNSSGHNTVRTIWQNAVDYDTTPTFSPWLPTVNAFRGLPCSRALDLWAYASDGESQPSEMQYWVSSVSSPACPISVSDNRYLYVCPAPNAPEWCSARVFVGDTIKQFDQWWNVHVIDVSARVFVPLIMQGD